jgi:hypothetical protein
MVTFVNRSFAPFRELNRTKGYEQNGNCCLTLPILDELLRRQIGHQLPAEVTESDSKIAYSAPLRRKTRLSVNLVLYVNSKFASGLRKEAGFFVFHAEMAARAGIEPATK